jgi:hypothetical protein
MTEQEAQHALLVYLKTQNYQYTAPQALTTDDYPGTMLYPVVTTYDFQVDLQIFFVCIVNPTAEEQAFDWGNQLAGEIMAQWAPPGEEPLEYDCVVWIGEVVRP